jgi:hypothetical protein
MMQILLKHTVFCRFKKKYANSADFDPKKFCNLVLGNHGANLLQIG